MPNSVQRGSVVQLKNTFLFLKTLALSTNDLIWMGLNFAGGSLTYTMNQNFDYTTNRGRLDDVKAGIDAPLDVNFGGKFTFVLSNYEGDGSGEAENYTLHEILKGVEFGNKSTHGQPKFAGTRESWLSQYGCPPYCAELEIHNNPAMECPDSVAIGEATLLRYFRAESIGVDFENGTCNVSGKCNILQPLVMRCAGPAGVSPGSYPKFGYSTEANAAPFTTGWVDDPRAA